MTPRTRLSVPLRLAAATLIAASLVPAARSQSPGAVPVEWAETAGVSVSGGALKKMAVPAGWNAGAVSTFALSMGDGYLELTAGAADARRAVGLGRAEGGADLADIGFAFELDEGGALRIHEAGEPRG